MRVTVKAPPLFSAISDIADVVGRGAAEIMECVCLVAGDNTLRLTTGNGEIEAHAQIEAATPEAGTVCVNAKDFKFAISAASGVVDIELCDAGLRISGSHGKAVLPNLVQEFPRLAQPSQMEEVEGGVRAFLACVIAASKDETRWHYGGVGFNGQEAIGTNGQNIRIFPATGGSGQMIPIGAKAIIGKIKGRLFVGETLWKIENEGRVIVGRLIDAKCPDLSRIATGIPHAWTCEAEALEAAIGAVSFNRAEHVFFQRAEGGIGLTAEKFKGTNVDTQATVMATGAGAACVCSRASLKVTMDGMTGDVKVRTNGEILELVSGDLRSVCTLIRDHRNASAEADQEEAA